MYKEDEMRINNKNKSNTVLLYIIASVLLFIVFLVSISAGSVGITLSDTIKLLTDHISDSGHNLVINESLKTILFNVRMPRVVLAAMVGAALSVSGAAMQGLLKTPCGRLDFRNYLGWGTRGGSVAHPGYTYSRF